MRPKYTESIPKVLREKADAKWKRKEKGRKDKCDAKEEKDWSSDGTLKRGETAMVAAAGESVRKCLPVSFV